MHPVVDFLLVVSAVVLVLVLVLRVRKLRGVTGFFHPYCNDGGGGERVLWCAVQALLNANPTTNILVYTGDIETQQDILTKANERFSIDLTGASDMPRIRFVRLKFRALLEASRYPMFTLLGQSLGGALLALEALLRATPEVFVDTMGSAPTYLVARYLMGCRVGCYVHYPTISTDMLKLVQRRETSYNNRAFISKSAVLSRAKLMYYHFLAAAYGVAGRASHATMVNSSWTRGHISEIWGESPMPFIVFPPCNTDNLRGIELSDREDLIISLGQFRPEKNHSLQIHAMAALRTKDPTTKARLVIIGSCRNEGDEARVAAVREEITLLGLEECVQVRVNVPWAELKDHWLRRAKIGLHTMVNEHFGINIVEFMAAGVVPIAHDSGGPRADIVVEWQGSATGKLASCAQSYAQAIHTILALPPKELTNMQLAARASVSRFSDATFQKAFYEHWLRASASGTIASIAAGGG
eukprot:CAMPEP_0179416576 /NCGR_PEP_ID=MMETSP0799-20121207/6874_1 /TAXON_ID=46947 /ORGANISM="Geminigera cryophila, Strain CCMP2564" /LENGTH=468 /DNA_ID=CAMNT_0021189461 /DNA_START=76 /DNA_END=1478 /DNA_ORIENTATION=-